MPIIIDTGDVFTWGGNDHGQLGTGKNINENLPVKIKFFTEKLKQTATGTKYTLFLSISGKVYGCGTNNTGQIGLKDRKNYLVPTKISSLDPMNVIKISAGYHSAAISFKGELYIWGNSSLGDFLTPQKVCKNIDCPVSDIKMGDRFTIVLDLKGNLWGFGQNASGELGNGNFESRNIATKLSSLKNKKVYSISCGKNFTLALGDRVEKNKTEDKELLSVKSGKKSMKLIEMEKSIYNLASLRESEEAFSVSDDDEYSISKMVYLNSSANKRKRDNWFDEERELSERKRESLSLDSLDQMIKDKKKNDTTLTEPDQFTYQARKGERQSSTKYIKENKKDKEGESAKKFESPPRNYSMSGLKNVLADMKILKIQNNLLAQQLEEKSKQILFNKFI